jgi:hypothetical protein
MRSPLAVLTALTFGAGPLAAQQPTKIEVGTQLGVTGHFGSGNTEWSVGVPAPTAYAPPLAWPSIYLTVFPSPSLMVEPAAGFAWSSTVDQALFVGSLQLGYLLEPTASTSPYFAIHGGWTTLYGQAKSGFFGGGVGIRILVQERLSVRTEARFRRWTCAGCDLNEVALNLGLGAALP